MREINSIIIHCSDSEFGNAVVIDEWHKARGWDGIGYHFIIGNGKLCKFTDGNIEIGRPLIKIGAHVKGHNNTSIGICLIGRGKQDFTRKQLVMAKHLCLHLIELFNLSISDVIGHYELDKNKRCPVMDMNNFRKMLKIY